MDNEQHLSGSSRTVERRLARLRAGFVGLALVWVGTVAWLVFRVPTVPRVLAVERLEIVEPDGARALVLANSQRPVPATIDGQVILEGQEEERRGVPSIIFFDGKGDEVGGMLFGVRETENGYSAVRHLSFDAYGQDQTVVLAHYQSPSGSRSGLTISDRPEHSTLDALEQLGLEPGATREELTAAVQAIPEAQRASRSRELFGTARAFFGTGRDGRAQLILMDGQGRARIVVETPETGEPSIQVLDEEGAIVLRLPAN